MEINSNKTFKKFIQLEVETKRKSGSVKISTSPYFGQIGSIPLEDIFYEDQLFIKKTAVNNLFSKFNINIPIIGSPVVDAYRFRMDFVCSHNPFHEPNNRFGQRKQGKFNWVIDMNSCSLISAELFTKLRTLFDFAVNELKIPVYDLVSMKGNLRYFVIRSDNKKSLLAIVTQDSDIDVIKNLAEKALELGIDSIHHIFQPEKGDHIEGELIASYGESEIIVELYEKNFLVGPKTFFQNNIKGFELICDFINDELSMLANKNLLYDLYSGVGTLGIIFANLFKKVIGFELIEDSVALAKRNVVLNKVTDKIEYFSVDLNKFDEQLNTNLIVPNETLIVDPPRVGLQKNGVEHVLKFNPKMIIYISCNPVTQMQDILELGKFGYKIKNAKAFDLFPHTYHLENVVILNKE